MYILEVDDLDWDTVLEAVVRRALDETRDRRREAAEMMGVSVRTLYEYCKRFGIPPSPVGGKAKYPLSVVIEAYEKHRSTEKAAEELEMDRRSVARRLKRAGYFDQEDA